MLATSQMSADNYHRLRTTDIDQRNCYRTSQKHKTNLTWVHQSMNAKVIGRVAYFPLNEYNNISQQLEIKATGNNNDWKLRPLEITIIGNKDHWKIMIAGN